MTINQERPFVSNDESWKAYVGSDITPEQFVKGYLSAEDAVYDYVNTIYNMYVYQYLKGNDEAEKIPSWLRQSLINYIHEST